MARPNFMDISTDLKTLILSYIIRPRDLVNVCLTCKQFHEIAVRHLYHTVILDLGSDADKRLPALLNPRNIGLRHIKNVELYKAEATDLRDGERQADLAMRMLLEFLPEDQLERWSFHPWTSFSKENLILLYKRQKKMKWLEAIALDELFYGGLIKTLNLDAAMDHVTKLGLYPDSRDTLDFAHELLKRAKRVTKITLHTNFDVDTEEMDNPVHTLRLNDTPTGHGLLTRTIFGHMLPFDKCTPLNIVDLTMQRVHLRYAPSSFCKVIDFPHLQHLRISECSGADGLLAGLCNSAHLPNRLKTFEFKHDDDGGDCEATAAMEAFLCLVSGIDRLTIDLGYTRRFPNESCVTRHARTLKLLNIHANRSKSGDIDDEDEHVCELEAFEKICNACTLLEQLSVAFPPTFVTCLASEDFSAFSQALGSLLNLVTLNVTSWPANDPGGSRMPRKHYEHLLQGMAQTGFTISNENAALQALFPTPSLSPDTLISTAATAPTPANANTAPAPAPPAPTPAALPTPTSPPPHATNMSQPDPPTQTSKLRLIAFGASDKISEREDSKNIAIFYRGVLLDPLGRGPRAYAVPVSWRERKYVEPRSEVLDFGLMRSVRPPTTRLLVNDDVVLDW